MRALVTRSLIVMSFVDQQVMKYSNECILKSPLPKEYAKL